MVFQNSLIAVMAFGLGWGFFSSLVAMSCVHDARYAVCTVLTNWAINILICVAIFQLLISHGCGNW